MIVDWGFNLTKPPIKNVLARVNMMCPALILAASRKESVNGRRKFLNVSISTKKGFNQVGAPAGSRCARNDFGSWDKADRIIIIHKGIPKENEKRMCEDNLNEYGSSPIKLIEISNIKSGTRSEALPFM